MTSTVVDGLTVLGAAGSPQGAGLETFPAPPGCFHVRLRTDEVTAVCPVTGQPDWYTVTIEHGVEGRCVESKSLKLYLQGFRDDGMFCEAFAARVAADVARAVGAQTVVTVDQKPRGGVAICAMAEGQP